MSKKVGLGKGLGAIFSENSNTNVEAEAIQEQEHTQQEVSVKKISANPYQPRQFFSEEKLEELAGSIKEYGIVQPLVVRKKGVNYELVAGERRLRAAKMAGLENVPVIIKEYDDDKMMEIALIENIQRNDLNPIEEAHGLRRLMVEFKLTQEQAAEKVGRSRVAVTNILRLLNLPEEIQNYIINGTLNMGQAKQLLGLPQEEQQITIAKAIIENGWSSRMTEDVVRRLKEGKKVKITREIVEELMDNKKAKKEETPKTEQDVFCHDFETRLIELLGTKVKVMPKTKGKHNGGTIQIEYYSPEDLERIYEALQNNKGTDADAATEPRKLNV